MASCGGSAPGVGRRGNGHLIEASLRARPTSDVDTVSAASRVFVASTHLASMMLLMRGYTLRAFCSNILSRWSFVNDAAMTYRFVSSK